MTSGRHKCLLRDHHVMPDVDVVLVVEPNPLADPRPVTDVELPRELHSSPRAEHNTVAYLGTEGAENTHAEARADLPWIGHEEQFADCPEVHLPRRPIPGRSLAGSFGEVDDWNVVHVSLLFSRHLGEMSPRVFLVPVSPHAPRLLVLGLNYPPEKPGISPYTGAMARGMVGRGVETRALTAHPHYPEWKVTPGYGQWTRDESIDGVRVTRLRHYIPTRPSGLRRALSELTFGLRLAGERWGRPAAIIAVSPALISTATALLRSRLTHRRTPFIVWVQDLYSLGLKETGQSSGVMMRLMMAVEGWVLRRASHVVVIHDRFALRVHEDFGVPLANIEVIRNWTHLAPAPAIDREAAREQFGWGPEEKIVLHAGNMGVKQGLDNVVMAGRLSEEDNAGVRFVLLGNGSERSALEQQAAGLRAVTFMDALSDDDFTAALQAADALLVNEKPGVAEMAVPSKLTSYFSAGRPVLAATDASGITAEEVERSGAGVVVPAGDPRALLDAARELTADVAKADALGASGRRFRDSVLTESRAIDAFEALLSRLIDGDEPLLETDPHPVARSHAREHAETS